MPAEKRVDKADPGSSCQAQWSPVLQDTQVTAGAWSVIRSQDEERTGSSCMWYTIFPVCERNNRQDVTKTTDAGIGSGFTGNPVRGL
jgi:hypothetical protein